MEANGELECLSCGGREGDHVMSKPLASGVSLELFQCRSCGLVFSCDWRAFADSQLYDYYAERIDWPEERIHVEVNTVRLHEVLRELRSFVLGNALLDVGCGSGELVRVAVEEGWDALGIDFSEPAIALCRRFGLPCDVEDFFSRDLDDRRWDVITMSEVIEHVPKPGRFLTRAEELLAPGGVLYITTPNFSSLSRRILGPEWKAIGPDHISYFTPQTLKTLIAQNSDGEVREISTRNISIQSLKAVVSGRRAKGASPDARTLDDDWSGSPTAAPDYKLRRAMQGSRVLGLMKSTANGLLSMASLGDTIFVVLQKSPSPATRLRA